MCVCVCAEHADMSAAPGSGALVRQLSDGTNPDNSRAHGKRSASPTPDDGPVLTDTDLYRLLGVDRDADNHAIKKAYYRMAKQFHPDKGGNEEDFKKLQRAYEVLSDSDKRREYDETGRVGSEDDDMDVDSFEEMFPPATWADFEGTVYARDADEPNIHKDILWYRTHIYSGVVPGLEQLGSKVPVPSPKI